MDDYSQPDAPEDAHPISAKAARRGSRGNRAAQAVRYQSRNRVRLNDYRRRYRQHRRASIQGGI